MLEDPFGRLYLTDRMYEKTIQFMTDRMNRNGGSLDIFSLDTRNNLEDGYIIASFERLLPYCNTREPGSFFSGLETVIYKSGVKNNADPHYLNSALIDVLKADCGNYARLVENVGFYKWQEKNKMFLNWLAETTTTMVYAALAYSSIRNSARNNNQNSTKKIIEKSDSSKTIRKGNDCVYRLEVQILINWIVLK